MSRMKPYFDKKMGTVTVANSCGITDGAAMLLMMRESRAVAEGYQPLARMLGARFMGCDPLRMGLGPVHAMDDAKTGNWKSTEVTKEILDQSALIKDFIRITRGFDDVEVCT